MNERAHTQIEKIIKHHLSARMERRPYRRVSVLERKEGEEARVDLSVTPERKGEPDDAGLAVFECRVAVTPARESPRESMDVVMEVIDLLHRASLDGGGGLANDPVIIDILFRKAHAVGGVGASLARGVQLAFDVLVELDDWRDTTERQLRAAS